MCACQGKLNLILLSNQLFGLNILLYRNLITILLIVTITSCSITSEPEKPLIGYWQNVIIDSEAKLSIGANKKSIEQSRAEINFMHNGKLLVRAIDPTIPQFQKLGEYKGTYRIVGDTILLRINYHLSNAPDPAEEQYKLSWYGDLLQLKLMDYQPDVYRHYKRINSWSLKFENE